MDHDPLPADHPATERVSTGVLPPDTDVQAIISAGYERYLHVDEGAVADYIPALAAASPGAFGVCVAGVKGRLFSVGDADQEFAIESISKLFVFALVCHTLGHEEARRKLGVNSTGVTFASLTSLSAGYVTCSGSSWPRSCARPSAPAAAGHSTSPGVPASS